MREIMRAGKDQTKRVHVADTMTNHASGSLRDTSSPRATWPMSTSTCASPAR